MQVQSNSEQVSPKSSIASFGGRNEMLSGGHYKSLIVECLGNGPQAAKMSEAFNSGAGGFSQKYMRSQDLGNLESLTVGTLF